MDFNPEVPDQRVRMIDNPARGGVTTGRARSTGPILFAEVEFGPNERQFKPVSALELIERSDNVADLFRSGRFSAPQDLRRLLTFEKLRGELTNVFYSMEVSNTDFYPHQFKPVLTFVESTLGRLLVADEVGLGKTIEAMLIWLELQAREDARRLLVICPSMLREKWRRDLKTKFNIDAQLVDARQLLEQLNGVAGGGYHQAFACIASLEGLRPPKDYETVVNSSPRSQLAQLLAVNPAQTEHALIDLAIIDESHYLRNPATASNQLGRLLRDAAQNMLLLTATPIQLGSENLYQMLRLIDPDFFSYQEVFDVLLQANAPVVAALRALWSNPPQIVDALKSIRLARSGSHFAHDQILKSVEQRLQEAPATLPVDQRIELARMVETRSLLSHYMVRSRKRDVLEQRVIREAHSVMVSLSDTERELYNTVTHNIRELSRDAGEFGAFRLIARQRQLASCMPAAIEAWEKQNLLDEYLEEYLWEDFGIGGENAVSVIEATAGSSATEIYPQTDGSLLDHLENHDSKYSCFYDAIQPSIASGQKVVVFAFYRGTLAYLSRRLSRDGIRCIVLKGGMGPERQNVLEAFERPDGPNVLLSSEVGSEGIDLQFCRIMVNYDLPWNPMRVEQRIGRIDRLGQQSEKISIINLFLADTIEDRILQRLYERIRVFQQSIGDLEEILGDITGEIARSLLDPDLSDQQREEQATQTTMAIETRRIQQDQLEQQAVNLVGFTDYLLDSIHKSRERGRWVSADELIEFARDFFLHSYPGTILDLTGDNGVSGQIQLSDQARTSLERFVRRERPVVATSLHRGTAPHMVTFNPRAVQRTARQPEVVTARHPLLLWIAQHYERGDSVFHSASAALLSCNRIDVPAADYLLLVQRWSVRDLRTRTELAYQACDVASGNMLSADKSEAMVALICRHGQPFRNAANRLSDMQAVIDSLQRLQQSMSDRLAAFIEQIELENEVLCDQEEQAAHALADRRIAELEARVARFRHEDRRNLVPMTEGLIRSARARLDDALQRVTKRRKVEPGWAELVSVLVRIE